MAWDEGYISEINYTYGYYRELSPLMLNLGLLRVGVEPQTTNHYRYLELGFGQGLTFNLHAASNEGEFWGIDFNPSHALNARELAKASGANIHVFEDSFAEFLERPDVPQFDAIVLHGIWSWVSDENRKNIVEIIRRKLAIGGVVYISYNVTPGWSPMIPLRDLMMSYMGEATALSVDIAARIQAAVSFAEQLMNSDAKYFSLHPETIAHFGRGIKNQKPHYLAHEFFNKDWKPMTFAEASSSLAEAKITYAGWVSINDDMDIVNITENGRNLLNTLPRGVLRETTKDYLVNRYFRKDLWVKGATHLNALQRAQLLNQTRFSLIVTPQAVRYTIAGVIGSLELSVDLYPPLVECLALNNYQPKTPDELKDYPQLSKVNIEQIREAIFLLCGLGYVAVVNSEEVTAKLKTQTNALNEYILERAIHGDSMQFLASPVTGVGIGVGRLQQLFLLARVEDHKLTSEWADLAWQIISMLNERLVLTDGRTVETAEESLAELNKMSVSFEQEYLPLLIALGVVSE